MTWRRPHWRERSSHPEDDLRPHEAMRVPTLIISSRALARGISGPWVPRRSGGIEDARFFHQQANWCYQLAWQCFDLAVALAQPNGEQTHSEGARALVAGTEGTTDAEARRS